MNNRLSGFAKYMMLLLMAVDIIIMLLLPLKLNDWMSTLFNITLTTSLCVYYYTVLYLGGLCGLYILNNMRRLFSLMQTGSPFVRETQKLLKNNALGCMFMAVITLSKVFVELTFMTVVSVLIFFTAGVFCSVLSELFSRAIDFKEENDLTV